MRTKLVDAQRAALTSGPTPLNVRCPYCGGAFSQAQVVLDSGSYPLDYCTKCDQFWIDSAETETFATFEIAKRVGSPGEAAAVEALVRRWHKVEETAEQDAEPLAISPVRSTWEFVAGMLGLPVEVEKTPARDPYATWGIGLAIVAFTAAVWAAGAGAIQFGFVPAEPLRALGLTALSSFLLHADLFHLLGNLYFLVVFGDNVEVTLGVRRYLLLILSSSVFADLVDTIVRFDSAIPSIGASAGISGLLAFYCLQFPDNRFKIAPPFYGMRLGHFWSIRAPYFALSWLALQVYGLTRTSDVNYVAHLSGAAVGLLFYIQLRRS